MRAASAAKRSSLWSSPEYPGKQGTPFAWARALAPDLLPNARMAAGEGPIQVRPASTTAWAKSAFSLRKP